ncbi:MAG: hypothetical protein ACEPOZ_15375 [Marinifilaceae bacterium]
MTEKEKTCFVIMPISDQESYDKEHFTRVYKHIIKPACEKAGFTPIRADEQANTNYIVLDIIKKILESDMVICDLSAKNPNVMYELGIRQAFNKKALLIKDIKTDFIFDIQGLRTLNYDESLRVDTVISDVNRITKGLNETYDANEKEVNSLVQMLSISPASISDKIELSKDTTLILNAINSLKERVSVVEKGVGKVSNFKVIGKSKRGRMFDLGGVYVEEGTLLTNGQNIAGELLRINDNGILLLNGDYRFEVKKGSSDYNAILSNLE